jgi:cell wall-associated NlpC family hydrolase
MMYPWVKKYIGIPFVSNGRTFAGCDCYGLVRLVLQAEYGVTLPLLSGDYTDALNRRETERLFAEQLPVLTGERIPGPEEQAVAVITSGGQPCHLGIVSGGGSILHAGEKTGSVCQRITHPALRGRIAGYYRVR